MVDRDTFSYLRQEDYQLSSLFHKQFISLHLGRVLRQLRIRVGQGWNLMSVVFFSLPLIVPTVWEEVSKCFVTIQPCSELGLPDLELLFCETSYWEFFWRMYFGDRHGEAGLLHYCMYQLVWLIVGRDHRKVCTVLYLCSMYCNVTFYYTLCTILYPRSTYCTVFPLSSLFGIESITVRGPIV